MSTNLTGRSPRDDTPLAPVETTSLDEVKARVLHARSICDTLRQRPLVERRRHIEAFGDALLQSAEPLARLLEEECGKVSAEAWLIDIMPTADLCAYWAGAGAEHLLTQNVSLNPFVYPSKSARIERVPRGVIALITPWNFPVAIALRNIVPALLAGNAVVWKPSEYATRIAQHVVKIADQVFGPGALSLVVGEGEVAQALLTAGVDAAVFTGGVQSGRAVAETCAKHLLPVALELGGKDAAIVLPDCDLERTARGLLWASLANAGQNCAAIERIYVQASIYEALYQRMKTLFNELRLGEDVGAMTTGKQRQLVKAQIDAAKSAGASVDVLVGGEPEKGQWIAPVLVRLDDDAHAIFRDETFGPVVAMTSVQDIDDAVARTNAHAMGLTASLWTRDVDRANQIASRLRVGVVTINNHSLTAAIPNLPWSGVGQSGYGVTNSEFTLDIFTRPKTVLIDRSSAKREVWWFPYTPSFTRMLRAMVVLRRAAPLTTKLRALWTLVVCNFSRWRRR